MRNDNFKTAYELCEEVVNLISDCRGKITLSPAEFKEIPDVTSSLNKYAVKADKVCADSRTNIIANAGTITWDRIVDNVISDHHNRWKLPTTAADYIEYAKVPHTTNCQGTFKFELGFDEKEKERKEKMNESEKENLRKFAIKIEPKRILQNGPVTVVFWGDGTKTIVRRSENSVDDPYSAFCAALAKKIYGNNSRVKKILDKKTVKAKAKEKKGEKKDDRNAENPES